MSFINVQDISKTFKVAKRRSGLKATLKSFFKRNYIYVEAVKDISFQIEKGEIDTKETFDMLEKWLEPMKNDNVDTIVLGCTHYPLIDFVIKKMDRLEKFYKYGLSQAGWNKYSYYG